MMHKYRYCVECQLECKLLALKFLQELLQWWHFIGDPHFTSVRGLETISLPRLLSSNVDWKNLKSGLKVALKLLTID